MNPISGSWKRTIVITRSRALLRGQIRGIRQHLTKKMRALRDLQKRIVRSHEPDLGFMEAHDRHHPQPRLASRADPGHPAASDQKDACPARSSETNRPQP